MKYWILFILFIFQACKSDTKKPELVNTGDKGVDEAFLGDLGSQEIKDSKSLKSDELIDTNQKVVSKKVTRTNKEAKGDSIYSETLKEGVAKSIHKGKGCTEIMNQFEQIVNKAIKMNDPYIIITEGWDPRDIIFQKCLKTDTAFNNKYNTLNKMLGEIKK